MISRIINDRSPELQIKLLCTYFMFYALALGMAVTDDLYLSLMELVFSSLGVVCAFKIDLLRYYVLIMVPILTQFLHKTIGEAQPDI